jgi:hypothetical protein
MGLASPWRRTQGLGRNRCDCSRVPAAAAVASRRLRRRAEESAGPPSRTTLLRAPRCGPYAAEGVEHEGEKTSPSQHRRVGEIRDPADRDSRREVAPDQVGPPLRLRVGLRRPPGLAAPLHSLDPLLAHQPLHRAASNRLTGPPQRLPHAPVAVGVVVLGVQLADQANKTLVLHRSPEGLALAALLVGGRRHAQGAADRLDPEAAALLIDVADRRACPRRPPLGAPSPDASRERARCERSAGRPQRQADASLDQLIRILLRSSRGRGGSPLPRTESSIRGLRQTRPGSTAG